MTGICALEVVSNHASKDISSLNLFQMWFFTLISIIPVQLHCCPVASVRTVRHIEGEVLSSHPNTNLTELQHNRGSSTHILWAEVFRAQEVKCAFSCWFLSIATGLSDCAVVYGWYFRYSWAMWSTVNYHAQADSTLFTALGALSQIRSMR